MDWDLFIDESGDFARLDRIVVVGGVLVPRGRTAPSAESVGKAISSSHHWAKAPHHAADLDKVAGQLGAWISSGRPVLDPADERKLTSLQTNALRHLESLLRKARPDDARLRDTRASYLASVDSGDVPPSKTVHAAEEILAGLAAGPRHAWAVHAVRTFAQVYSLRFATAVGDLLRGMHPAGVAVAAAEGRDALPFVPTLLGDRAQLASYQDRFLRLLSLVVERALELLRDPASQGSTLFVNVSYRDLEVVESSGDVTLTRLKASHLDRSLLNGGAFAWPPGHTGPRVALGLLERYDSDASPWFVVADRVVWRMRQHLALDPGQGWAPLAADLSGLVGCPVEARCSHLEATLPAISAAGHARDAIVAARARRVAASRDEMEKAPSGWARDQAREWTNAMARSGGSP